MTLIEHKSRICRLFVFGVTSKPKSENETRDLEC